MEGTDVFGLLGLWTAGTNSQEIFSLLFKLSFIDFSASIAFLQDIETCAGERKFRQKWRIHSGGQNHGMGTWSPKNVVNISTTIKIPSFIFWRPIDLMQIPCIMSFMWKFMSVSKWLLLSFSLALFIFAPSVDLITCNDCSAPVQGKYSPKHLCSFCFNTTGIVSYHIIDIPLISIPIDIDRQVIAFSSPAFSIDKPPQN